MLDGNLPYIKNTYLNLKLGWVQSIYPQFVPQLGRQVGALASIHMLDEMKFGKILGGAHP